MNPPRRVSPMDVTILLGSSSDLPIAKKCTAILEQFDVPYQLRVASAHRSPKFVEQIVHDAEESGCMVFVAMMRNKNGITHIADVLRICTQPKIHSNGGKSFSFETSAVSSRLVTYIVSIAVALIRAPCGA